jgi:hypothetical protein
MNRYELRIAGELGDRRRRALGCEAAGPAIAGESRLLTRPLDQAGLFGLLASLRDAGIELISIQRIQPTEQGASR